MCRDIFCVDCLVFSGVVRMLFLGCVSRETLDQRSTNDCRPDPADDLEGTPQRDPIGSCSAANRQSPV